MDAATMKPRLIPDPELLGRDNSGGLDYKPHTGQFGDGGYVQGGDKQYLTASGGGMNENDEMAERTKGERGSRKPAEK